MGAPSKTPRAHLPTGPLQSAGIPYVEYELSERVEALAAIKAATGQSTVPQVGGS